MDFITIIIIVIVGVILISFVSGIIGIIIIIVGIMLLVSFFTRSGSDEKENFAGLIGMGGANFSDLNTYDFKFNLQEDSGDYGYDDQPDGCIPFRHRPYIGNNVDDFKHDGKMGDYANIIDMAPYLKQCWKLGTFRNCWNGSKAFQGNVMD